MEKGRVVAVSFGYRIINIAKKANCSNNGGREMDFDFFGGREVEKYKDVGLVVSNVALITI